MLRACFIGGQSPVGPDKPYKCEINYSEGCQIFSKCFRHSLCVSCDEPAVEMFDTELGKSDTTLANTLKYHFRFRTFYGYRWGRGRGHANLLIGV